MLLRVRRGEMYYVDLSQSIGSEQYGRRPILIISNDIGNYYSPTVVVAAITGTPKKMDLPIHYLLPFGNGLEVPSVVMLEQIRTIDKKRLGSRIGQLNDSTMKEIDYALAISMGLLDIYQNKI